MKKKKKKSVWGWFQSFCPEEDERDDINPDAGNVPLNNKIFNQGFANSAEPSSDVSSSEGTVSEQLEESSSMKPTTPYMLRRDGKLLECGSIHPYINYDIYKPGKESLEFLLNERPEFLRWFYKNTSSPETKEAINDLATMSLASTDLQLTDEARELLESNYDIREDVNGEKVSLDILLSVFNNLNDITNQEFCRVRTSHIKAPYGMNGDTYFRISSEGFNWYPLIYNIVSQNESFVESITITNDTQALGGRLEFYKHKGMIIHHMQADTFLTLSGNPLIESYANYIDEEVAKGKTLNEIYPMSHPFHLHEIYRGRLRNYLKENFTPRDKNANEIGPMSLGDTYFKYSKIARDTFKYLDARYGRDCLGGKCIEAADIILDKLKRNGLGGHYVEGYVIYDYDMDTEKPYEEHNWVETDDGYVIDVTGTQFNHALFPENKMPSIYIDKKLPNNYSYEEPRGYDYDESLSSIEAIRKIRLEEGRLI